MAAGGAKSDIGAGLGVPSPPPYTAHCLVIITRTEKTENCGLRGLKTERTERTDQIFIRSGSDRRSDITDTHTQITDHSPPLANILRVKSPADLAHSDLLLTSHSRSREKIPIYRILGLSSPLYRPPVTTRHQPPHTDHLLASHHTQDHHLLARHHTQDHHLLARDEVVLRMLFMFVPMFMTEGYFRLIISTTFVNCTPRSGPRSGPR